MILKRMIPSMLVFVPLVLHAVVVKHVASLGQVRLTL